MVVLDQAVDVESVVRNVTMFTDRAQVFRHATVALKPGNFCLRLGGNWTNVDENSLQVAVDREAAPHLALRSVSFQIVHQTADLREGVAAAELEVKQRTRALRDASDRLQLVADQSDLLGKLRVKAMSVHAEPTSGVYDAAKWEEMSGFFAARALELARQRRVAEREVKAANNELQAARSRLSARQGQHGRQTSRQIAEVLVTVDAEVSAQLVLSYMVKGASWRPVYDLRVSRVERAMNVSYNAMVKQSTGEKWNDVRLELSTAKAHTGGQPPAMSTWFVNIYRPQILYYREECLDDECERSFKSRSKESAPPSMRNMMQQMVAAAPPPPPSAPRPSARVAAAATAEVTTTGTSVSFGIAAATTIGCDGEPVRVTIAQFRLGVVFRYSAVPKIDPHTYLKVKAKNSTPFLLLPGSANVFADQEFVCKTDMSQVAPNEEFWTFLGVDEDIKVTRTTKHIKTSESSSFMSGKRTLTEHAYMFTVLSSKATVEELVVWDQMPISQDKKLTLQLVHPGPSDGIKFAVNDVQFVEWFLNMRPGQEARFDFVFTAEHAAEVAMV